MDVIPWAVYNGDPVGVTINFVDAGVDTGNITAQEEIELTVGDTLKSLKRKANRVAGRLMAETILKIMAGESVPNLPQNRQDGKLYYRMPLNLRQETEHKLSLNY